MSQKPAMSWPGTFLAIVRGMTAAHIQAADTLSALAFKMTVKARQGKVSHKLAAAAHKRAEVACTKAGLTHKVSQHASAAVDHSKLV